MDENKNPVNVNHDSVQKTEAPAAPQGEMKFCRHCGQKIPVKAVVCTHCGCQVEEIKHAEQPGIIINNTNTNSNVNKNTLAAESYMKSRERNKWVALLLCLFLGVFGGHKFYEKKIGMGILYIFTAGLFGIGVLIDLFVILFKPNPYYI